ncbi:MAG: 16S rRNA (adenine(1518)-N(6)/adenine(1519)-N(6))-dimethyltransferase RsmA [Patescibacteria group bacterium]
MVFAKKSLGQNFLMHRQTAERIVQASKLPKGALVLEIGPGTGMLTNELLQAGMRVIAVEADYLLIDGLKERFAAEIGAGKLQIISADIRGYDIQAIPSPYHVVANIPYYITGELIRTFLSARNHPVSLTFLVQKEVAERIVRSKKESLLSLSVKVYGIPEYCFTVPRGAFVPMPSVDSAVLRIGDISKESFADSDEEIRFFDVLHAGFAHKRKRLAKNLEDYAERAAVSKAFAEASLGENARSEELSLSSWLSLTRSLKPSARKEG